MGGDLAQFFNGVDGEELDADAMSPGDIRRLLDGIAEGDPVRRSPCRERRTNLARRGRVEARAGSRQAIQDLRGRIGLHGIEDLGCRQGRTQGGIFPRHHVKVHHQAGCRRLFLGKEPERTFGPRPGIVGDDGLRRQLGAQGTGCDVTRAELLPDQGLLGLRGNSGNLRHLP